MTSLRIAAAFALALLLIVPPAGRAQPAGDLDALRKEVETLKQGQFQLQRELEDLKALLRRLAAAAGEPPDVVVAVTGHPTRGSRDARLTLVEFSDYECPFCGRYFRETLPQIERDYVQTGKIRYVFRNFPLEAIHKEAFKAAQAADCAGEQGRYWEMHDRLFSHQDALAPENLPDHAREVGLDVASFRRCLDSGRYAAAIRQDLTDGQRAGVRGTPSFFFGVAAPDGTTVKALRRITGAVPYAAFKETIDGLLSAP